MVGDYRGSRLARCAMLEALSHTPVTCASGEEALAAMPGREFDLALLDVVMLRMNGYELLEHLRALGQVKSVPVIMVTAQDGGGEVIGGRRHADCRVANPFTARRRNGP